MGAETFIFSCLLAANIILEWELAKMNRPLRRLLTKYKVVALAFSIFLSLAIGNLFGAQGILCFAAALLSTFVMQLVYIAWRYRDTKPLHRAKMRAQLRTDLLAAKFRFGRFVPKRDATVSTATPVAFVPTVV